MYRPEHDLLCIYTHSYAHTHIPTHSYMDRHHNLGMCNLAVFSCSISVCHTIFVINMSKVIFTSTADCLFYNPNIQANSQIATMFREPWS